MGRPSIAITRRIQWFDTDASTKYHNTAPLRLMEEAEAALLDRVGLVHEIYGFLPRVHATIDYRRPLRFWDEVEIRLEVLDLGDTSISYGFSITKEGDICAEGRVVAVLIDGEGAPRRWSQEHRRAFDRAG